MVAALLEDSVGTVYVRPPQVPYIGGAEVEKGDWIDVSCFAPLEPVAGHPEPGPLTVTFWPNADLAIRADRKTEVHAVEFPSPPVESSEGTITALGLDEQRLQFQGQLDTARAEWYRKHGRFEDELRWRWEAYRESERDLPRGARMFQAPPIADCLRRLGRDREAEEVLAKYGEPKFKIAP